VTDSFQTILIVTLAYLLYSKLRKGKRSSYERNSSIEDRNNLLSIKDENERFLD